jgi:hypothetical protein
VGPLEIVLAGVVVALGFAILGVFIWVWRELRAYQMVRRWASPERIGRWWRRSQAARVEERALRN